MKKYLVLLVLPLLLIVVAGCATPISIGDPTEVYVKKGFQREYRGTIMALEYLSPENSPMVTRIHFSDSRILEVLNQISLFSGHNYIITVRPSERFESYIITNLEIRD